MRIPNTICLMLFSSLSMAGVLTDSARENIVKSAFSNFWGHAVLSDGKVVQPESDEERKTLPISNAVANQVLDVGAVSGLAEWCGLDWRSHYLSMTAAARKAGFKEKQVAFIGVLHGRAQGTVAEALKTRPCTEAKRTEVQEIMKNSPNKRF